jgi:hypothetical protein
MMREPSNNLEYQILISELEAELISADSANQPLFTAGIYLLRQLLLVEQQLAALAPDTADDTGGECRNTQEYLAYMAYQTQDSSPRNQLKSSRAQLKSKLEALILQVAAN